MSQVRAGGMKERTNDVDCLVAELEVGKQDLVSLRVILDSKSVSDLFG